MIKHWAKLSCLVLCGQLVATACTTENDDDEGDTTTTSSGGSGGTAGSGTGGSSTTASGGSAGEAPTTTTASGGSTGGSASGGTASGGTAGGAGDGNEAGSAGAAGASTEGYDGEQITNITGPDTVTNGGTFTVQVTIPGADEDQTFQVAVNGEAGDDVTSSPNDDGVFEIPFAVPEDADGDQVTVTVTPLDGDGDAGESEDFDSDLIESGTGDVKVTLSFDQSTDLDLYVREPSGEIISFDNTESETGGILDIDSNPQCELDERNLENIFWPTDSAPEGEYTVAVDYYEACVETTVNYTVTITIGDDVETITGSFEAAVAGTEDGFREVGTFTVE